MYIQSSSIVRLLKASWIGRASWRRQIILPLALTVVVGFNLLLNGLRALDYIFAPGFRKVQVRGPVFVVATPRSGTTFLHHLLALDEQTFTHQKLYQTVFPAVLTNYVVHALNGIESELGIPWSRSIAALNERIFQHWKGIHSVRIDAEEEDESLFFAALASPSLYLLMPFLESAPEFQDLTQMDARRQAKLSRDYQLSVKRHLYTESKNSHGNPRELLIKNVLLPSRLALTKAAFPDAKFIRLVRDPRTAIPSAMSLFFTSWRVHSPSIPMNGPETKALGEMFINHYRRLHDEARGPDASKVLTIRFEDLIQNPVATVEMIYQTLGYDFTENYAQILEQTCRSPKAFKSEHSYSLADFGLTEADIIHKLGDIMQDLGYEASEPVPAVRRPAHSLVEEQTRPPSRSRLALGNQLKPGTTPST